MAAVFCTVCNEGCDMLVSTCSYFVFRVLDPYCIKPCKQCCEKANFSFDAAPKESHKKASVYSDYRHGKIFEKQKAAEETEDEAHPPPTRHKGDSGRKHNDAPDQKIETKHGTQHGEEKPHSALQPTRPAPETQQMTISSNKSAFSLFKKKQPTVVPPAPHTDPVLSDFPGPESPKSKATTTSSAHDQSPALLPSKPRSSSEDNSDSGSARPAAAGRKATVFAKIKLPGFS